MPPTSSDRNVLDLFLPPVRAWFQTTLGDPTPAQGKGWPAIANGENTLILAPTGSGKTLAAFLACLDYLWRHEQYSPGVQVLYISPLKALNNDIYRNLQVPLDGVAETANRLHQPLMEIKVGLRTGDTPPAERQRLIRKPPQVLITTPESLHLMLTSKARETLRNIKFCIVDEIHALCTNKRGVFLALLLERLAQLNSDGFVRIGLSATQRPLEEVARYLGGSEQIDGSLAPRPVTIVDAGLRKNLDLQVVSPVKEFGPLPEKSVWPSIYRRLFQEIRKHRSTIVFANNRRSVERITTQLNRLSDDSSENTERHAPKPLARAHHGSVSLNVRRATEEALKAGNLSAVVATASLELGIDMGAVDLVCQVESPGSVARGLQRVGRAGHLVGQKSKGRLIPKTQNDLVEQAVLVREMIAGNVEACRVPTNCLDVLAQQIVAMVAMDDWSVTDLLQTVRQAYSYRDVSPAVFETVLEMISGRYRFEPEVRGQRSEVRDQGSEASPGHTMTALQPRVSWDRVHNRLLALPGTKHSALSHSGTIPDTGQYAAHTTSGVRIGELDEEFIYERRVGDTFLLGTHSWRIEQIGTDRVIVSPADRALAMIPFWRGENTGRSYDLGVAIGRFLSELQNRKDNADCLEWLQQNFCVDADAATNLRLHMIRQTKESNILPTDRTIVIEAIRDELGDWQVLLLSPLGSRLHLGLRLAIENRLRNRLGYRPQCLHHDNGILFRLTEMNEPVLDLFDGITTENVKSLVVDELGASPLFALRFRQNASRALLLPSGRAGKRAPLWLQRLRGKDLLQVARRHSDFPIVVETFRECLEDYLDLPLLLEFVDDIGSGRVQVIARKTDTPSPFASDVLFQFNAVFMYQYDEREISGGDGNRLDQSLLDQLLTSTKQEHLLDARAVQRVESRLRGFGRPPRDANEMAEMLRRVGDLKDDELAEPMPDLLLQLEADGRVSRVSLNEGVKARWVFTEYLTAYQAAFDATVVSEEKKRRAQQTILLRFLNTHALVGLDDVMQRYPFDAEWAETTMDEWSRQGRLVTVPHSSDDASRQWSAPEILQQVQRTSLSLLRREVSTVSPARFVEFLLRWQNIHPESQAKPLADVMETLAGVMLPAELWEQSILPSRINDYQPRQFDDLMATGEWIWYCHSGGDASGLSVAFMRRTHFAEKQKPELSVNGPLDSSVESILSCLENRGALFVVDICQQTDLPPHAVRNSLWNLLQKSLVTNDRFDVVRRGKPVDRTELAPRASLRPRVAKRNSVPGGRWSLLPWNNVDRETAAISAASLLLNRYGIVARDLALLDGGMPAWRDLYEVLKRMELAGDVRRGYFVEGLSGSQFALPEAAQMLNNIDDSASPTAVLLHSLDPANLYGSGLPFAVGDDQPAFARRIGNWLVVCAGQPVLLIEQNGKRLSSPADARDEHVHQAVQMLPQLLSRDRSLASRRRLTVKEWNGTSVGSSAIWPILESAGFVRDYMDMTLYSLS